MRCCVLCLLAVAACGHGSSAPVNPGDGSAAPDAAVDASVDGPPLADAGKDAAIDFTVCPAEQPAFNSPCSDHSATCPYGGEVCYCRGASGFSDSNEWYCVHAACPKGDMPSGTCTEPGLNCHYHFEWNCICSPVCSTARWRCVGGQPPDLKPPGDMTGVDACP